ncbi:MAG: hypothetical protein WHV67_05675 [Thermoanaerobaculia bacterium]
MIYVFLLNNYLHDLFTATFFIVSLIFLLISKLKREEVEVLKGKIIPFLNKIFWVSFFLILLSGFPRVYYFLKYEVNLDRNLQNALVVKHIFLLLMVILCFIIYFKFKKCLKNNFS